MKINLMEKNISGFSKLSKIEKINWLIKTYFNNDFSFKNTLINYWNSNNKLQDLHDEFVENTVSNFYLPLGVAPNFIINGKYVSESLESTSVINDDYLVFDINSKYKISSSVNVVVKLLNIFDEKYSYVTATYPSGSYYRVLPRQLFIGGSFDF